MSLQLTSVLLQGFVALLFLGSLLVARRNLVMFWHANQATLLKNLMDEYRELIADGVFERYEQELEAWEEFLVEAEPMAPTMAYYTRLTAISAVGFFYEKVGLLVRQGLLDFTLCFEVVPMAYKFWRDTARFRATMKKATYAEFWDPFEYLHDRYVAERARRSDPVPLVEAIEATTPGSRRRSGPRLVRHFSSR